MSIIVDQYMCHFMYSFGTSVAQALFEFPSLLQEIQ